MQDKEKLLEMTDMHVHYGGVRALDGVSFSINEGEVVALMGPNGAGKSTILKALFGLAPIHSGQIHWRGNKIKPIPHEMVPLGISLVPQGKRVFKHLTVRENLEIGGFFIKSKRVLNERIEEALDIFPDLRPKLKQKAGELSGGQQQMVAIGRGLISNPEILLLDEPSLGLAPKIVKEVFEKIAEVNIKRKMAIIIVEHNIKSALNVSHRVCVLDKGKMFAQGDPKKIVESGTLEKVFLAKV
jgi:branched-chain amino acid transport system ATP-binding protein